MVFKLILPVEVISKTTTTKFCLYANRMLDLQWYALIIFNCKSKCSNRTTNILKNFIPLHKYHHSFQNPLVSSVWCAHEHAVHTWKCQYNKNQYTCHYTSARTVGPRLSWITGDCFIRRYRSFIFSEVSCKRKYFD